VTPERPSWQPLQPLQGSRGVALTKGPPPRHFYRRQRLPIGSLSCYMVDLALFSRDYKLVWQLLGLIFYLLLATDFAWILRIIRLH
jgi:hypothetical protein